MRKFILILVFCSGLFATSLEFETLSADFVQDVKSEGSKITYSGDFIANQDSAFWHYETPNIKNIYFSAQKVIVVEPELEQAIFTTLRDTPSFTDILLSAKKDTNGNYEAFFDDTKYQITLKNGLPSTIKYKDKLDNEVTITLSNVRKNESIDEDALIAVVPQNFDIIAQ